MEVKKKRSACLFENLPTIKLFKSNCFKLRVMVANVDLCFRMLICSTWF